MAQRGNVAMTLGDELARLVAAENAALDAATRRTLAAAIERLRMLQIVEHGLVVGDVLPDFALPDATGRIVTSEALLAEGPLAIVFFRGPWCPYCSATLEALEAIRPRIEALGATLVGVAPMDSAALAKLAAERRLGLLLLADAELRYAAICGVRFEMPSEVQALYRRFAAEEGLEIAGLDAPRPWALPVPASYVTDRRAVIHFAFSDADWARRAEPEAILAAVTQLAQAAGDAA